jgi:hypothetical protein
MKDLSKQFDLAMIEIYRRANPKRDTTRRSSCKWWEIEVALQLQSIS